MIRLFRVVLPASILALFISEALLLLASFAMAAYFDADFNANPFYSTSRDGSRLQSWWRSCFP